MSNAFENVSRHSSLKKRILLIASPFVVLTVVLVVLFATGRADKDVFEKLYYGPPREQVLSELGEPDDTYYDGTKLWGDTYRNVSFLGETGYLVVYYQGTGCVTSAHFVVTYPASDPNSKQLAHKYADDIAKFYTQQYGDKKDGTGQFSTSSDYWSATIGDRVTLFCTPDSSGEWEVSIWLQ